MKRSPMRRGTTELKRTPFKHGQKPPTKLTKRLKTKQLAVTAAEKKLWDRLANEIGCIACLKDGQYNKYVSIHHIDGRTKPGCHALVLPLCAPHHQQDDTDPMGRVAVHPFSARFERKYGSQMDLLAECMEMLEHGNHRCGV